jgi:hypothetical protein
MEDTLSADATVHAVAQRAAMEWPMLDEHTIRMQLHVLAREGRYADVPAELVEHSMYADAVAFCAAERAAFTHHTGKYLYTPGEVLAMLGLLADTEAFKSPPVGLDGHAVSIEAGNAIVSLWDVQQAVYGLSANDRAAALAYAYGSSVKPVERRSLARVVRAITDGLNGS